MALRRFNARLARVPTRDCHRPPSREQAIRAPTYDGYHRFARSLAARVGDIGRRVSWRGQRRAR